MEKMSREKTADFFRGKFPEAMFPQAVSPLRRKLEELGLREEYNEPITLHSGVRSRIKWETEWLFQYTLWVRLRAIEEFIWEIGKICTTDLLVGIRKGGYYIAQDIGRCLQISVLDEGCTIPPAQYEHPLLIDDVLTTGMTIRHALGNRHLPKPDYIAVLINRSGLDEIEGIPVLSGIKADPVGGVE